MEQCTVTSNGVRIYSDCNPHLHGFCLSLYLKAGCLYETDQENGISHFYEHIAVRNLNHICGGNLYKTLDLSGLTFNASTGQENIQFEMWGARIHFRTAASLLARLFEPIILPSGEIDIERKRIKAEIREEDEKSTLYRLRREKVWEGTALANSILGTPQTLNRIGKHALSVAHDRFLSPNNLFFYVTGAFDEEDLAFLKSAIESASIVLTEPLRENLAQVPVGFGNRKSAVHVKRGDETRISFSFDLDTHRFGNAERTLLYDILFNGENALFYQALSETTGYVYSFAPVTEDYNNIGVLTVDFEIHPLNFLKAARAAAEVFLKVRESVTEEIELVRPPYVDNAGLLFDDCSSYNWTRAYESHILDVPYRSLEERVAAFESVRAERIVEMAREVFVRENMTICVKGDPKRLPVRELQVLLFEIIPSANKR